MLRTNLLRCHICRYVDLLRLVDGIFTGNRYFFYGGSPTRRLSYHCHGSPVKDHQPDRYRYNAGAVGGGLPVRF